MDTARKIAIAGSPTKLALLAILGVVMTGLSAVLAFLNLDLGLAAKIIGWIGTVFFGLCTLIALWRGLMERGPVITISPEGIRDTRVSASVVPWRAITGISTWSFQGQQAMVLAVDSAIERTLGLSLIARWSRGANRALGADGLAITASGVKIDYDALLETSLAYWQAYRGRRA